MGEEPGDFGRDGAVVRGGVGDFYSLGWKFTARQWETHLDEFEKAKKGVYKAVSAFFDADCDLDGYNGQRIAGRLKPLLFKRPLEKKWDHISPA